jgi:NAD(P)-dependent dehydrogenase (short-subunit alcohol dehydrogenase family)
VQARAQVLELSVGNRDAKRDEIVTHERPIDSRTVEDLRDKVALVTGGAGGLGSATCRALAEAGAEVVVADLDEDRGTKLAQELGGHFVAVDVTDLDANRAMVKRASELAGGLDLAFLNAGVTTGCGLGFRNVPGPRLEPAA